MYLIFKIYEGWWDAMNIKRFCWVIPTWNLETAHMYEKEWVKFHKSGNFKKTMPAQILPTFQIQFGFFCSNKAIAACIVLNHYQFNGTHRVTHCLVIIWNIPSPRSFWTNSFLTYMYVKKEKPFVYRQFSQIMACKQHSHNEISRNTPSKSYMLSWTECVWDNQNKALWDTRQHALSWQWHDLENGFSTSIVSLTSFCLKSTFYWFLIIVQLTWRFRAGICQ